MVNLGAQKEELDTPCLLVDLDVMERNINRMAEDFRGMPAKLRPHFKTPMAPLYTMAASKVYSSVRRLRHAPKRSTRSGSRRGRSRS